MRAAASQGNREAGKPFNPQPPHPHPTPPHPTPSHPAPPQPQAIVFMTTICRFDWCREVERARALTATGPFGSGGPADAGAAPSAVPAGGAWVDEEAPAAAAGDLRQPLLGAAGGGGGSGPAQ
jgi:hypothetical protein